MDPSALKFFLCVLGVVVLILPLVVPIYKIKNLSLRSIWAVHWFSAPIVLYGLMSITSGAIGSVIIVFLLITALYNFPVFLADRFRKAKKINDKNFETFHLSLTMAFVLLPVQAMVYEMVLEVDGVGGYLIYAIVWTFVLASASYLISNYLLNKF